MPDVTSSFNVDIGETGGDDAASSLEALRDKILSGTGALREMQTAMRNMKAGGLASSDAFDELKAKIDAQKQSIAGVQAGYLGLGGTFSETGDKAKDLANGFEGVGDDAEDAGERGSAAIGHLPGVLGRAQRETRHLKAAFDLVSQAGPWGIVAGAIALVTVGIIAASVAIAAWAVGLADAKRNQDLATEGLAASSKALAGLAGILPSVQAATGLATADLQKMAVQLDEAGVSAANMPDALRALATATAGGASAKAIKKLNDELKNGTKTAKQLAVEMDKTFGPIARKKMLSLDAQGTKLKNNIAGTFGGLKIEDLLGKMSSLVDLFDSNTASGKAMKLIFEGIFQPMIDGAAKLIPYIKAAFIQAMIWALKAYIALKPYGAELKLVGEVLGGLVLGAILAVVASVGLFVAFLAGAVAIIGAVGAAVVWLGGEIIDGLSAAWDYVSTAGASAWDTLKGYVQAAIDWVSSIDLVSVGVNLIEGLVSGITNAGPRIISALTGLVGAGIDAVKSMLGIASPSKVFMQLGHHTGAGMALGMDRVANDVEESAGGLATAAVSGAQPKSGAAPREGSPSSSGVTIHIQQLIVQGVTGADDPLFAQKLAVALEEAATIAGFQVKAA